VKKLKSKQGEVKKSDLAFLRGYKFKMSKQLTLLGYGDGALTLELKALATMRVVIVMCLWAECGTARHRFRIT